MKKSYLFFISLYFALLYTSTSASQNIAAYSGTSTPTSNSIEYTTTTPLSRGSGITPAIGTKFTSTGWTTRPSIDSNDYIEWSITADPEYIINISSLEISYKRSDIFLLSNIVGYGPKSVTLKSSLDGYTADLFTDANVSSFGETNTISTNLSSAAGGTVTFRLYGYNAKDFLSILGLQTGTFNIENNLGTVLNTSNTGIILNGTVEYDGIIYSSGSWTPYAPSLATGNINALVLDGTYTESGTVEVNNLKIIDGAATKISKTGAITINGDLITTNNLTLESDSDEYSSIIVNGAVTGTAVYKRHVNLNASLIKNDLISAPVTGETFGSFALANSNIVENPNNISQKLFGPFNKNTNEYQIYDTDVIADANVTLDAAVGYRAASTDDGTFTFTGTIETTTKTIAIFNTGTQHMEWNLIGNPYPSYIKLSDFLDINDSQFDTPTAGVYGYDGNASDGWHIWNKAYSDAHPNTIITPGQGFIVSSKSGGGTVTFTPSMRSIGDTDDFIANRSSVVTDNGYISLLLTSTTAQNYGTTLYFNPNASLSMDKGYDATVFNNSTPEFAIYSHLVENSLGKDMAAQAVSYNDLNNIEIPLGLNIASGQEVTLSIKEFNIPEDTEVILKDNLTNTFTDLKAGNYTFSPNTDLNGIGRFYIHFSRQQLSVSENKLDDLKVYTNMNPKSIMIDGQFYATTQLSVYDIHGRIVATEELSTKRSQHTLNVQHLSAGIYIVHLQNTHEKRAVKIILN